MTRKIRVLIVDDSTVIRRLLSDTLTMDRDIEIAGSAANGKIALAKIPQVNPDVITLDMEMPEMDGISTLVEIRKLYPKLPVIMFSTLTERGAHATFDALAKGANDYVTKPANVGSVAEAINNVQTDLTPKVKALCEWYAKLNTTEVYQRQSVRNNPRATRDLRLGPVRIDVVAIGVSTGGPNALATVLPQLSADFPVPIVIVQHMPPIFTKHLADRLDQACQIKVKEAEAGETLRPGTALVAPGGMHMIVHRKGTSVTVGLNQDPLENFCRPAVDVLFRSVTEVFGARTLATVLTGMGRDGLLGCEQIRDCGGTVIAQDEATSVVWGMPGVVSQANLADRVLPLNLIAGELIQRTMRNKRQHEEAGERHLA